MPPPLSLREVTRAFARGDATLETLRKAAIAEIRDRQLANALLQLIADWENSPWTDSSDRARNELRARARKLAPAAPAPPPGTTNRRPPGESIYAAGLRGQQRRRD